MRYLVLTELTDSTGTHYQEKYIEAESELDAKWAVELEPTEIIRAVQPLRAF